MRLNARCRSCLEWASLSAGLALLALFGAGMFHRAAGSHLALRSLEAEGGPAASTMEGPVDFSLWAQKRIRAYRESLTLLQGDPMAVLAIDRLRIKAPVFAGTDDLVLNRGVGWIPGTAKPGAPGNSGVAGHRDGFFRRLKDVAEGDLIEIRTRQSRFAYRVENIAIVLRENVGVLGPRGSTATLTLVTCYPFNFIGDAPRRFIVQAKLEEQSPAK